MNDCSRSTELTRSMAPRQIRSVGHSFARVPGHPVGTQTSRADTVRVAAVLSQLFGSVTHVHVLGHCRSANQVEVLSTEAFAPRIDAPVRISAGTMNTPDHHRILKRTDPS